MWIRVLLLLVVAVGALGAARAAASAALCLPAGEPADRWTDAAALGGFRVGSAEAGERVVVTVEGARWRLHAVDARGGVHDITVPAPTSAQAREDMVWLARSLLTPVAPTTWGPPGSRVSAAGASPDAGSGRPAGWGQAPVAAPLPPSLPIAAVPPAGPAAPVASRAPAAPAAPVASRAPAAPAASAAPAAPVASRAPAAPAASAAPAAASVPIDVWSPAAPPGSGVPAAPAPVTGAVWPPAAPSPVAVASPAAPSPEAAASPAAPSPVAVAAASPAAPSPVAVASPAAPSAAAAPVAAASLAPPAFASTTALRSPATRVGVAAGLGAAVDYRGDTGLGGAMRLELVADIRRLRLGTYAAWHPAATLDGLVGDRRASQLAFSGSLGWMGGGTLRPVVLAEGGAALRRYTQANLIVDDVVVPFVGVRVGARYALTPGVLLEPWAAVDADLRTVVLDADGAQRTAAWGSGSAGVSLFGRFGG